MTNITEVEKALTFIDPASFSYTGWTQIGMAINAEFPGNDGLALFDDWSARDPERYKPGECAKKWKSFKKSGFTIGTVFYYAKQNGYKLESTSHSLDWDDFINDREREYKNVNENKKSDPQEDKKADRKVVISENNNITPELEENNYLIQALTTDTGEFKDLITKAQENLFNSTQGLEYLKQRGYSKETARAFNMGFLDFYHHKGEKSYTVKDAFFFADTFSGYVVRKMHKDTKEKNKYLKPSKEVYPDALDVPTGLHLVIKEPEKRNPKTGYTEPIFICEGYPDAPSFYEIGLDAVALNGANSNLDKLIEALNHFEVKRPLIVALDNDREGKKNRPEVTKKLKDAGFSVFDFDVTELYGDYKDANEILTKNKAEFIRRAEQIRVLPVKSFDKDMNAGQLKNFEEYIENSKDYPPIPTGFKTLDAFLDGGLYPGLYVIGAVSSVGKTSFILQIADSIARHGTPVLYLSLEMLAHELRARSISRYTLMKSGKEPYKPSDAKTARGILNGVRYAGYHDREKRLIEESKARYFNDTGNTLMIYEAMGTMNAERITKLVEQYTQIKGRPPVVLVDYLQLLIKPNDEKGGMTDKQITDANIFALKQLSRNYNIPIVMVSSFNRENYFQPVSMLSFKESGAIEYSSDVLLGMEMNYIITDPNYNMKSDKEKKKQLILAKERAREKAEITGIKDIKLKILKNRNGKAGDDINYKFFGKFNYYQEQTPEEWALEVEREQAYIQELEEKAKKKEPPKKTGTARKTYQRK